MNLSTFLLCLGLGVAAGLLLVPMLSSPPTCCCGGEPLLFLAAFASALLAAFRVPPPEVSLGAGGLWGLATAAVTTVFVWLVLVNTSDETLVAKTRAITAEIRKAVEAGAKERGLSPEEKEKFFRDLERFASSPGPLRRTIIFLLIAHSLLLAPVAGLLGALLGRSARKQERPPEGLPPATGGAD